MKTYSRPLIKCFITYFNYLLNNDNLNKIIGWNSRSSKIPFTAQFHQSEFRFHENEIGFHYYELRFHESEIQFQIYAIEAVSYTHLTLPTNREV